MANDKIEHPNDVQIEKLSGGSLEHHGDGFRVFDSSTNEDFGTYKDWNEALKIAKQHKVSGMGTWGDDEIPFALLRSGGLTREDVRLREDRTHKANPVLGTGSFEK